MDDSPLLDSTHLSARMDISSIADNLERDQDGIWVSRARDVISYPEDGNLNSLALEADSFWFAHRLRCIQASMERWRPPGAVFDIGGGNGYVAMGLQDVGIPVALVEPGWHGVRSARERGVHTLVHATLESAGFHAGSLPAVGLFDVLEHIEDDGGFLATVHRLLQPGGRVYLSVPAYPALWSVDDDYAGHYRRYTIRGLRRVLRAASFEVEYTSCMFSMLPLPIFLLRSIPSRLGMRKQKDLNRYRDEHRRQSGIAGRVLDRLLAMEISFIRSGRSIPMGGSCLMVAKKKSGP